MKTPRFNCSWLVLALCLGYRMPLVQAGPPQLVTMQDPALASVSSGGDSVSPVISQDGRYVLFSSSANNLITDTNGVAFRALFPAKLNVFLRDRTNGTTSLVSVSLDGSSGGNGDSIAVGISTNGQYALFESSADNLVAGDTNTVSDVFVRDLVNNTTTLVSVNASGGCANGVSRSSIMTPDGRFVAFVSAATNLVAGDTNTIPDIFVRDLQGATTTLVSVGAKNVSSSTSESPDISTDGRYVVFYSTATGLAAGTPSAGEIYVRDLIGGSTIMVSAAAHSIVQTVFKSSSSIAYNHTISDDGQYIAYEASQPSSGTSGVVLRYSLSSGLTDTVQTNAVVPVAGNEADYRSLDMTPDGRFIAFVAKRATNVYVWDAQTGLTNLVSGNQTNGVSGDCYWPQISADGNVVSFFSSASNLVTLVTNKDYHLYVRNIQAGTTIMADARMDGSLPSYRPTETATLSADGRFIAFESFDSNLVSNDFNHATDFFVRDLVSNTVELISARLPALPSTSADGPVLPTFSASTDARFIAFSSSADNLAANDTNGCADVFIHDKLTGSNILVSVATNGTGPGNGLSFEPAISADGRYVAFTSSSSNLVAVADANKAQDVFVRDVQGATNILVSINTAGTGTGNAASYSPIISGDGRYVLFHSKAGDLAAGVTSTTIENLFVRDVQSATTRALVTNGVNASLISTITADGRFVAYGGPGITMYVWDMQAGQRIYTNAASVTALALTADGQHLAYSTSTQVIAVDLVAGTNLTLGASATNGHPTLQFSADGRFLTYCTSGAGNTNQVNLLDFQTGTNLLVSLNLNLTAGGNGHSDSPAISPDGRFVAYRSAASDIFPGDTNGMPDIFLYDQRSGSTTLITASAYSSNTANNFPISLAFSGDSQTLLFQSWASDLVPQDFNQGGDLFAMDLNNYTFSVALTAPGNLAWPLGTGKNYQVLYKDKLTDSIWQPLSGTYQTNGGQGFWSDPAPPTNRFYRVVAY